MPIVHSKELAIFLPQGRITPPANPYGRLIANAGLYRALARYGGYRNIHFQSHGKMPLDGLAAELFGDGSVKIGLSTGSPLATEAPARAGVLLSGQPYLSELAWIRRHSSKDDAYSIVGSIFAFASPTHRERMMRSAMAPLHDWDALICTSPALEEAVRHTFDHWEEYLRERIGASRLPRPALPVIPLGVDVESLASQASDAKARSAFRNAHSIADTDVVVFFLGRLSFYDKAYPQAMFKAVEAAQRSTEVKIHFVMAGWFPSGERDRARFGDAARCYAPGVNILFQDGNDAQIVAQCWAASDIFLLLSDTILETFGQAPVEAMAAGLPLVVSDWNGYRAIVRDRIDGFLIPTLGAPAGPLGETLALLQSLERVDYIQYAGAVSQHTAVHVGRAAEALSRLVASPGLRASMGAAGKRRAREMFSWPIVVAQYQQLFAELTERRLSAGTARIPGSASTHSLDPLRPDPFAQFQGYPSAVMHDDLLLTATVTDGPDTPWLRNAVELDDLFSGLRGSQAEAHRVVSLLHETGPLPVRDVLSAFPNDRRPFIRMSLLWLAKSGLVDWLETD